jgi:malate dehydrogenase (oxaloacetate-decarboxylating)(NADP+)
VKIENIFMFNSKGLLTKDNRKPSEQLKYAKDIPSMNLEEALIGVDMF